MNIEEILEIPFIRDLVLLLKPLVALIDNTANNDDDGFVWGVNFSGMSGNPSNHAQEWSGSSGWYPPIVTTSGYSPAWASPDGKVSSTTNPEVDSGIACWDGLNWAVDDANFTIIRLPVTWERLTIDNITLNGFCVPTLDAIFARYADSNVTFIIDLHNDVENIKFNGNDATAAELATVWRLIATKWKDENVWFEIFNEPPDNIDITTWTEKVEASITSIRETGAMNKILVDGINYTNIHNDNGDWAYKNASLVDKMKEINDVNFAFSIHQYFDVYYDNNNIRYAYEGKYSGSAGATDIVWDSMDNVTKLLRDNNFTAYLTETNILKDSVALVDNSDSDYQAMETFVGKMKTNYDVWKGLCAWQVNFDYNNSPDTGNIWNGPVYQNASWKSGPQSTANWFVKYLREI